jgi:hypothetical protein
MSQTRLLQNHAVRCLKLACYSITLSDVSNSPVTEPRCQMSQTRLLHYHAVRCLKLACYRITLSNVSNSPVRVSRCQMSQTRLLQYHAVRCFKLAYYSITLSEVGLKEQPLDCEVSGDCWDERSAVHGRKIGLLVGSTER